MSDRKRLLLHIRRPVRCMAAAMTVALAVGLASAPAAQADPPGSNRPEVADHERTVKGKNLKVLPRDDDSATKNQPAPKAAWPKPGSAEVTVTGKEASRSGTTQGLVRAGSLPVSLTAPGPAPKTGTTKAAPPSVLKGSTKVSVLDRNTAQLAGVQGLMFTLTPDAKATPGRVGVRVDYSAFAQAFGGSYGTRLRLVQLPACALTTPNNPECRTSTPVITDNNGEARTLTADVETAPAGQQSASASPVVLAAAAAPAGSQGDFTATKLEASATWQVSGNTGDFTWDYPMRVPPVPGSLTPQVTLGYSAQSVDGRAGNTNNQPSWAGEGFEYSPGFIERRYKPCEEDGAPKGPGGKSPGDLCWGYENATVTWNGKGGELVKAADGIWKLKNDDGTKFELLTDPSNENGDEGDNGKEGEYWKVTTTDGTQYFFGRNHLPGYDSGTGEPTRSTWTVPVFGPGATDRCHKASGFADSWCQQAWRWNLDMVLDTNDNAIAYYYQPETNRYGRNLNPADATSYTRGGYLTAVEYGLRGNNTVGAPAARVNFQVSERCIPTETFDCAESKISANPDQWPDVPWDMNCNAGQRCESGHGSTSPTFWSRKRLTKVTTQINKGAGWPYRDVDSWSFVHEWGKETDERDLLLKEIQHTGLAGPAPADNIALPKVSFKHTPKANRVDQANDGIPPYTRYRVEKIFDEVGGEINVSYTGQDCSRASPPTPQTNTRRCFPSIWHQPGKIEPIPDWFNKFVTTSVVQKDRTGHAPDMATQYEYIGDAAWHFDDDDGLTRETYKTWSQWRGYGQVRVKTGSLANPSTQTDTYYLRGMHGDRATPAGGTKTVTVPDGEGGTHTDAEGLEGFALKTVNYTAPGGTVHDKSVDVPWRYQTASRTRDWATVTANVVKVGNSRTWTALDGGAWRQTKTTSEYETDLAKVGRVKQVEDLGDVASTADDKCTRLEYADNQARWMVSYQSRAETVSVSCGTTPDRPKHVIADAQALYDGGEFGAAPTKGNVTQTKRIAEYKGSEANYSLLEKTTYDSFGRPQTVTNAADQTTTTRYTDSSGVNTRVTVTTPAPNAGTTGLTTTTELDPAWGLPTAEIDNSNVDGNNKPLRSDLVYDSLGRVLKVWQPNRSKSAGDTPSLEHSYRITDGQVVAVTTKTLTNSGGQRPSIALYDGLLRPRQTQSTGPEGRLITDTFYDDRSQTAKAYATYSATGAPEPALFNPSSPGAVETQNHFSYDGLGRPTTERLVVGTGTTTEEKWRSTTSYGGDWVAVDPPQGATPSAQITDARGQVVERRQYQGNGPSGAYDATTYGYDPAGRLTTTKDPSGKTWTNTYDLLGRRTQAADPDTGVTTFTYDALDRVESTTDARHKTIFQSYDGLGRHTQTREGSATGKLLSSWTYDTAPRGKGKLAAATRHGENGDYVRSISAYDVLGRPESSTVTIPASEGQLAGTYTSSQNYNLDGTPRQVVLPAAGGLLQETLTSTYDDYQRPIRLTSGQATYVGATEYTPTGKPKLVELGSGNKRTWNTLTYQYGTQRLATSSNRRENVTGDDRNATYTYDDAGNVLGISDVSRDGTDNQCFKYDHLRRLTDAWSVASTTCPQSPSVSGGPAPYRMHYTYELDGSRAKEQFYNPAGTQISTRDYRYQGDPDVDGTVKGHMLGKVDQTGANPFTGPDTNDENYVYDDAGNPTSRTVGNTVQNLEWNSEGNLDKVTQGDATVRYIYDADGNRLIRKDLTGATLYLDGTEIRATNGSTTAVGTRYYGHNGQTVALRDPSGLKYLAGDHQGTAQASVNATDQKIVTRRFTPFGQERGTAEATWPDQRGFLGGTKDPTGLTHLGAREYDPNNGRFISVDPLIDLADPQQMNGYLYGGNNPATFSDPDGLFPLPPCVRSPFTCGHKRPTLKETAKDAPAFLVGVIEGMVQSTLDDAVAAANKARNAGHDIAESFKSFAGGATNPVAPRRPRGDPPKNWKAPQFRLPVNVDRNDPVYQGGRTIGGIVGIPVPDAPFVKLPRGLRWLAKGIKACRRSSFVPGTAVVMADGTTKPIDEIKKGDKVLATNPKTGKTEAKTVQDTITTKGTKNLVKITVDAQQQKHWVTKDDAKAQPAAAPTLLRSEQAHGAVIATDEHPFWVADGTGHWVKAADLKPGMWLRTSAGTYVQVKATQLQTVQHQRVHNLTVADHHTYYALAGATPILVHNCNNLVDDAARFPAAHVLDEHVNVSDQQLIAMAQASGVKSRFADLQTAQQVVDYGIASNMKRINAWLRKGGIGPLEINGRFGVNNSIGVRADASGAITPTGNAYTIILQRAAGHPGGYYVSTAYPR
ncbi:polymorphic toxin-type HINT domain-containing protein [Actinomadura terrae]|uniref:polymorphic toxin-type HINT domain-containing protein n=1 Tax=Actinomadura terrae TaxID=604353 RepID=UPI001FA7401F|nr:RNase A-like domain-containing protein [Actinomadura terrae]